MLNAGLFNDAAGSGFLYDDDQPVQVAVTDRGVGTESSVTSALASGINNSVLSFTVTTGTGSLYPAVGPYRILVGGEIMVIGSRSGDTFTVTTRGVGYGGAFAHSAGATVLYRPWLVDASVPRAETAVGSDVPQVQTFGGDASVASSSVVDATAYPRSTNLIALANRVLVMVYQAGSQGVGGIAMKWSADSASSWSSELQITAQTDMYPSVVHNPATNDLHVIYSKKGNATVGAGDSVFYRPVWFTGTPAVPAWTVGPERVVFASTSTRGFRNAVVATDDKGFCTAVCTTVDNSGTAHGAMAFTDREFEFISPTLKVQKIPLLHNGVRWAIAGSRSSVGWYFVAQDSQTFTVYYSSTILTSTQRDLTIVAVTNWLADSTDSFAVAASNSDIGIVYLTGGRTRFRRYRVSTTGVGTLLQEETAPVSEPLNRSCDIGWDAVQSHYLIGSIFDFTDTDTRAIQYRYSTSFSAPVVARVDTANEAWDYLSLPRDVGNALLEVFAWTETASSPYSIYVGVLSNVQKRLTDSGSYEDSITSMIALEVSIAEGPSNVVKDFMSQSDGVLTGVGTTLGRSGPLVLEQGQAFEFTGPGYVSVPHVTALQSSSFTVECWYRPTVLQAQGIVAKTGSDRWRMFMQGAGGLIEVDEQPGNTGNVVSSTALVVGNWYHLVFTYDATSQILKLFVNGVLEATATGVVDMKGLTASAIELAANETNRAAGFMDEFALYGYALSSDRILRHYQAATGVFTTSPYSIMVTQDLPLLYLRLNDIPYFRGADDPAAITPVGVGEIGVVVDALTLVLPISEIGVASENTPVTVDLGETAIGDDGLYPAEAGPLVSESGIGDDVPLAAEQITTSDSAVGSETVGHGPGSLESGTGSETFNVSQSVSETGSGAESITLEVRVSDAGSGVEPVNIGSGDGALTGVFDTGVGSEAVTARGFDLPDEGTGSDQVTFVGPNIGDSGTGSEAITHGPVLTETGSGADVPSVLNLGTSVGVRLLLENADVTVRVQGASDQ